MHTTGYHTMSACDRPWVFVRLVACVPPLRHSHETRRPNTRWTGECPPAVQRMVLQMACLIPLFRYAATGRHSPPATLFQALALDSLLGKDGTELDDDERGKPKCPKRHLPPTQMALDGNHHVLSWLELCFPVMHLFDLSVVSGVDKSNRNGLNLDQALRKRRQSFFFLSSFSFSGFSPPC
ncbi:uncharacterized protein LY79DRAFT_56681 [Colletotrichum navitas]|uniref:Uncharacterized protein n=1 Tax=Colletotrichum navitas TaxID=681940 RepID=A0AAD8PMG9_9PEZI|nr:uncharacterized protein LY79DRAFT_56681 [Colletotrichum navitas]KAK1569982.1 hypothetical protein LY79DRAFT_56681 [Colletotrichum navitas]